MNNYRTSKTYIYIAFWSIYFDRTELSLVQVNQPYLILQPGKIFMSRSSTQEPMHSDSISSISPKYIFHIIFRSHRETAGARPVVHFTRHTNSIETNLEFHRIPYDMLAFLTTSLTWQKIWGPEKKIEVRCAHFFETKQFQKFIRSFFETSNKFLKSPQRGGHEGHEWCEWREWHEHSPRP